jgi:hypothetical protein
LVTGRRVLHKFVEYDPDFPGPEELEGIDIWDLDSGISPGIGGQIHLIMLDNDSGILDGDDIYLKHFRVTGGDKDNL